MEQFRRLERGKLKIEGGDCLRGQERGRKEGSLWMKHMQESVDSR